MSKLNTQKGICMLGNTFTFFLGNAELGSDYYQYTITSPGLTSDLTPLLSMEKISEKTRLNNKNSSDLDLLSECGVNLGNESRDESISKLMNKYLKKDEPVNINTRENKFPTVDMKRGNNIQKSLIIGLRDSIRWKNYRLFGGRFVDILYTPTKFLTLEVISDRSNDAIWLIPKGLYHNTDGNMQSPLNVDLDKLEYPKVILTGKSKISDMNRLLKTADWAAFSRKEIK